MYKVEKNIEIPNPIKGGVPYHKYPFSEMGVGDSFAVNVDPTTKLNYKQVASRLSAACRNGSKRTGHKYTVRTLKHEKCIRVWRTK
tara:strand:+ start:766 stop:1023 length:258 start_codon:yes stop_codon:yes gene_type:complete